MKIIQTISNFFNRITGKAEKPKPTHVHLPGKFAKYCASHYHDPATQIPLASRSVAEYNLPPDVVLEMQRVQALMFVSEAQKVLPSDKETALPFYFMLLLSLCR